MYRGNSRQDIFESEEDTLLKEDTHRGDRKRSEYDNQAECPLDIP